MSVQMTGHIKVSVQMTCSFSSTVNYTCMKDYCLNLNSSEQGFLRESGKKILDYVEQKRYVLSLNYL